MNKNLFHSVAVLLALTLLSGNIQAQDLRFSAKADTQHIKIGEQVKLSLTAKVPAQSSYQWPVFPDTITGLEILKRGTKDTLQSEPNLKLRQNLTLTSFDSGQVQIPALKLRAGNDSVFSESLTIAVSIPQVNNEKDLYDVKAPLEVPRNWIPILWWAGGILLAIALGLGVWWYLRKRRIKEKIPPEEQIPPHELALKKLQELEKEQLWQAGHIKMYYSRLIDVLRVYLERQFGTKAMESTAAELSEKLETLPVQSRHKPEMKEMLMRGAMVKYAKESPGSGQNERALNLVRDFVEETKPQPRADENN